jgi:two-component system CheB/CheR fusion protein
VSIPIREEERQDFASILQKETDRLILNELTPPGVVVNGEMDILQFRGKTGLFLEPASGLPSFNLMKMTRNSLGVKLRLGIERAKKDGGLVSIEDVEVKRNESTIRLDLEVRPFRVSGDKEMFYLIVFRESSAGKAVDSEAGHEVGVTEERNDGEITGLRKELDETRAYLQSYVEEKDRSNEELRSANEELQANFEELQSINEELQTAREELQASNEELRTVNEELAARNAEISDVYNVLENMINSSNLAMIMVDSSLRIRRVTPTARRVFKMIPSDVGRPLGDLKLNLRVPNLLDLVGNTLTTFTSKTMEVQDNDERWYSMSIQLYRTTDNKIDGAVVTFVDVDRLKRAEASAERLVTVLSQSNDAITTLNPDGRITAWNRGAEVMYGYAPYEAMGMNISALTLPGDLPLMIDALERVKRGEFVPPFKSRRITKTGKTLDVMLTLTKLVDGTGRLIAIASLESSLLKGFASPG